MPGIRDSTSFFSAKIADWAPENTASQTGVTKSHLLCTENGMKNGEKMETKLVSKRLVKWYFNGAKTAKEKQKVHKFCVAAPAVHVVTHVAAFRTR